MNRYVKFKCVVLFFLFVLGGCKESKVSQGNVDIKIIRFEEILFSLDREIPDISRIDSNHYRFLELYSYAVLGLEDIYDEDFPEFLSYFLSDSTIRSVYDTVKVHFPDLKLVEKELSGAFYKFHHLFPEKNIPRIYTHISGFNQSIVVDNNLIGIGLDNYLGSDCIFYRMLANPIPLYIKQKMIPENMVRDVVYGWISTEFPFQPEKKRFDKWHDT
ncbi:MAG: hypothetical protein LIO65_07760 [Odoribacter sp.]|nr:hypothetical protein [Odoribacter sp.]